MRFWILVVLSVFACSPNKNELLSNYLKGLNSDIDIELERSYRRSLGFKGDLKLYVFRVKDAELEEFLEKNGFYKSPEISVFKNEFKRDYGFQDSFPVDELYIQYFESNVVILDLTKKKIFLRRFE